jgi:hypothetical protein
VAVPGGREQLVPVWFYLFRVSDLDLQAVHDMVATELDEQAGADMKTTADRLEEKGYRASMIATLLRLIERRFGAPDDATRTRVQQATPAELDRWLDAILDAVTLDALLAS